MIINQSACIFSLSYFLTSIVMRVGVMFVLCHILLPSLSTFSLKVSQLLAQLVGSMASFSFIMIQSG